jgi:hypothetical protein
MLTGKSIKVTLAHILPHSTRADVCSSLGLDRKHLDSFRNLLWLCPALEQAFDSLKLSFVPKPTQSTLSRDYKVHIWDESILNNRLWESFNNSKGVKVKRSKKRIKDVLHLPLTLPHSPYRRCLSYQAFMAYWAHQKDNSGLGDSFIPEDFDESDCNGSFKKKRSSYLETFLSDAKQEFNDSDEDGANGSDEELGVEESDSESNLA